MRAAVYRRGGRAADVIAVEDVDRPEPQAGEVRVKVAVSGVNPTDWKVRSATEPPAGWQIPHQDGAGTIDAVGPGVDATRVGQRVWVYLAAAQRPWGTAADYTVVPQDRAVPLPDGVDLDLAASLGIPALTAHHCLFADGPVRDSTVLVSGGAGAVGHFAIELARGAGARVISTVSNPDKARLAQEAGAHTVVDYTAADAAEQIRRAAPDGIDRVVEVAIHANLDLDLAVCRGGAVVTAYASGDSEPTLPVRRLMTANLTLEFVLVYGVPAAALQVGAEAITAALDAGILTPLPVHRFALDDVAAAQDAVEAGAVGKVLVDV